MSIIFIILFTVCEWFSDCVKLKRTSSTTDNIRFIIIKTERRQETQFEEEKFFLKTVPSLLQHLKKTDKIILIKFNAAGIISKIRRI